MAKEKKIRDKRAEKEVKARIRNTHLKSIRILGSEKKDDTIAVYILRMIGADNYLFKINCEDAGNGSYAMSGFIPVNEIDEIGEYRVYNPKHASAEALRPTSSEKKFQGYSK